MSIQVEHLTYIYSEGLPQQQIALSDVSLSINDGEFIGIIGHTGSGKSTLLQHLNGLLKPKSGTIFIGDAEITKEGIPMREIRRKVGLVFQYPEYQLFEETVYKDVAFGPLNLGLPPEEVESRVREAIQLVGLDYERICNRSPFELSGGQKRRIAIAGVVAMRPEVLILDEPTAGLDPKSHQDILDMIRKLQAGKTSIIILVSHNMKDIAELSDRIFVMEHGRIALSGTPLEVFSQQESLEKIGLGLPPVMEFMHELRNAGVPVEDRILSVADAEQEILRAIKGNQDNQR